MGGFFRLEGHSRRLQSVRGLAALSVAVGHSFTVMSNGRIEDAHFALRDGNLLLAAGEILVQPNTAVIVFYVLSGLVLSESLRRRAVVDQRLRQLLAFAARRLWRLLPVMWLSVVFAAAVAILVHHTPFDGTTGWFKQFLSMPVSSSILLRNLLGLSYSLNSVLWSVQIELIMIVLLPLMVWISARTSLAADSGIIAGLYVAPLMLWSGAPNFALFAYCFYVGVALPKFLSNHVVARCLGSGAGLVIALVLLLPVEYLYVSNRLWLPYKFLIDTLVSGFAIAFILLRSDCSRVRFLDQPALVWLGDVSYSFYCYAMSILILTAWALLIIVPRSFAISDLGATTIVLACVMFCIMISLVLAYISFTCIEMPSIARGHVWSKRIEFGGWNEQYS